MKPLAEALRRVFGQVVGPHHHKLWDFHAAFLAITQGICDICGQGFLTGVGPAGTFRVAGRLLPVVRHRRCQHLYGAKTTSKINMPNDPSGA